MNRTLKFLVDFWNVDRSLTLLLALLVLLLFVVTPMTRLAGLGAMLNGVVFTLLAITGTVAVTRRFAIVATVTLMGLARLLLDDFVRGNAAKGLVVGDLTLRAGFVVLLAVVVMARVFGPGKFSHHRVQGALVVYLLAALAWAYAYEMLDLLNPASFRIDLTVNASPNLALFRFFSFETLTTLGYGDVLPVSAVARSLASGEALFGQLFPAVMITRLMSIEFAERAAPPRL